MTSRSMSQAFCMRSLRTSTPWCSSSCSKVGYLANEMLSFSVTKHSTNLRPIRVRVSRSIVDKLRPIAEAGQHSGPAPRPHAIRSKSCHGRLMDVASSVVQHVAHLLIRQTSYPNLRKILRRLETFVLLTYGTVERRHMVLVSLKFTTKP